MLDSDRVRIPQANESGWVISVKPVHECCASCSSRLASRRPGKIRDLETSARINTTAIEVAMVCSLAQQARVNATAVEVAMLKDVQLFAYLTSAAIEVALLRSVAISAIRTRA